MFSIISKKKKKAKTDFLNLDFYTRFSTLLFLPKPTNVCEKYISYISYIKLIKREIKVVFGIGLKSQIFLLFSLFLLLFNLFLILSIAFIAIFGIIYGSHCTISITF